MPLLFTCPHCESKTLVAGEFAGKAGACVTCGKPITVPDFQDDGIVALAETRQRNIRTTRLIATVLVSMVVIGSGGFLIFKYGIAGVAKMQANAMRGACQNNVRRIATALNEYADDYGTYPTPIVTDASGKPLYSWRVLILPYLGQQSLYDSFNLDEPWDSEVNMNVAYNRPAAYGSPAAGSNVWTETNYMLITGAGTVFPASGPLSPKKIGDRIDQTLLVVEVARNPNSAIETYWTQPGDLDFARMIPAIGKMPGTEIGGNHQGGATAATCDGRDHFLSDKLSTGEIQALITPNGGEPIPDDVLDSWE